MTTVVTCLHSFFRAWRRLHVVATCFDWFVGLSSSVVIGQIVMTLVLVLPHSIENK